MKIRIKLNKRKDKQTSEGAPIVVYVTGGMEYTWATGYFSKEKEWNQSLAEPRQKHPQYYVLKDYLDDFLKPNISKVLKLSIQRQLTGKETKQRIFNKEISVFYDAVLQLIGEDYNDTRFAAIQSFNTKFPNLYFREVNREMVAEYIKERLKQGKKPAGVDSYIRSLRSLWNNLSDLENPFSSHKIEIPEKIQPTSTIDDIKKLANAKLSSRKKSLSGAHHYRNFWLLMFYLGGIDPEVLVRLRYDEHVVNGRIVFNRDKGQSKKACSNIIPEKAWKILQQYDCKPYLVPIYQSANTKEYIKNFSNRFKDRIADLNLSVPPRAKSARHTFVNLAQELLIDERITAQIVGHKRVTTTSLYTNDFPKEVQDRAHLKIIDL